MGGRVGVDRKIVTPERAGDGREVNADMDKLRYYSGPAANVHYFINRAAGVCYIRHIMHHGRYITVEPRPVAR